MSGGGITDSPKSHGLGIEVSEFAMQEQAKGLC